MNRAKSSRQQKDLTAAGLLKLRDQLSTRHAGPAAGCREVTKRLRSPEEGSKAAHYNSYELGFTRQSDRRRDDWKLTLTATSLNPPTRQGLQSKEGGKEG